jgi:hypothetical protein
VLVVVVVDGYPSSRHSKCTTIPPWEEGRPKTLGLLALSVRVSQPLRGSETPLFPPPLPALVACQAVGAVAQRRGE